MEGPLQWFLVVTAAAAFFVFLAFLVGRLLPEGHVARVSARVAGSPEEVWEAMTAPEAFPRWRPGVEEVEVLERDSGEPVRWTERGTAGSMTLEVTERRPGERLVLRIADDELPFGGTWTYQLEPEGGGTRVRITEEGEIHNPFFRFLARFVLGYEATMRDYLEGLEGRMDPGGAGGAGDG